MEKEEKTIYLIVFLMLLVGLVIGYMVGNVYTLNQYKNWFDDNMCSCIGKMVGL